MNKKLFSAAIFGALLLGTASTFVSCKDYDDDIQNLQTQVNDVKAAVAALEAKIGNGKLVTGVSSTATGITISLSDGSSYTVTNGKDGVDGAPGAAGADAQQITINEETGELMINGEGTGIKPATEVAKEEAKAPVKAEGGFWYVLNEDGEYDNTNIPVSGVTVTGNDLTGYTLTITTAEGTKEIKLPTAASTLNTINVTAANPWFTTPGATALGGTGIYWGKAPAAVNWAGPMGAIAKGDLLVGEISPVEVTVSPATYALDEQELTLVASNGAKAPVAVSAYSNDALAVDTRAAGPGVWDLYIEMDETVTVDNVEKIFTDGKSPASNLKYALAVNGTIMTGYDFVIDTWTSTDSAIPTHTATAGTLTATAPATIGGMPIGTTVLSYSAPEVYDVYLSFEGTDIALANSLGVTVDGMKVTAPAKAGDKSVDVTVNVIDVLGNVTSAKRTLTFVGATVDAGTVAATTFTVNPYANENIVINIDGAFNGMTEADIEKVTNNSQLSLSIKGDPTKVYGQFIYGLAPQFGKKVEEDNTILTANTFNGYVDDLRTLKYIVIPATGGVQTTAEPGDYTLVLTVKDGTGTTANEIKKIEIPVTVALPTFDSIFTKSVAWTGNTVTMNLNNSNAANFLTAYSFKALDSANTLDVAFDKMGTAALAPAGYNATTGTITVVPSVMVKDGAPLDVTAESVLTIGGASKMVVKSGKYTVKFVSPLNGAKLVNYVNGEAKTIEIVGATGKIAAFAAGVAPVKDAGLALELKGEKYALNATDVNTVDLTAATITLTLDANVGNTANATLGTTSGALDGSIDIVGLPAGTYTTNLTIKVTDGNGIVSTFVLPISVKN